MVFLDISMPLLESMLLSLLLTPVEIGPSNAQLVERRRDKSKDLGSNPSECHVFYLFRCVLSFSATLTKRWKVQFRLGLAINSTTLILITAY